MESSTSDSNGDPNISLPLNPTVNHLDMINGGPGRGPPRTSTVPAIEPTIYPGGSRSLSAISLHGLGLGIALSACSIATIQLALGGFRIWRLTEFIATLSLFHFLEFYTTARWNTVNAKVSSYLLTSNGNAYRAAHVGAMVEIIVTAIWFPGFQDRGSNMFTVTLGLITVVFGQTVRSIAMAQAGTNFNHIPAKSKKQDHVLVNCGIYAWSRHPSYFGYFLFAVGTQLVVGNKVCGIIYLVVLWNFFKNRIEAEEEYLVEFFGADYLRYRERTGTCIPFIR